MEFRQEAEAQALLKELVLIKARISRLLLQARHGLTTIQDAKVELARQTKEVEEQKVKVAKLDHWLESINNELKESTTQSDVLAEEDIIRYIEIYERYLREYEEYEIIIRSVIMTIRDDSSQLKQKLDTTSKTLEQTRNLVITEIERLRQILIHLRTVPEAEIPIEEDISQTDRTIDSTSMPEEIVTPREPELVKHEVITVESVMLQKSAPASDQESEPSQIQLKVKETEPIQISLQTKSQKIVPNATIETQTGKSLMSDAPSFVDKSVICKPEENEMIDVSITCAPPQEVEVQTSDSKLFDKEMLENIQVKQTTSEGHETIEIASRPFTRDQIGEQSLFVDAHYKDDNLYKDSQLNITHSLPQSFETIMVEPDETTTEVVVDADGTKRIIVKKIRKTLVTRQQVLQTQKEHTQILSSDRIPQEGSITQLTLHGDQGSSSTALDDSGTRHIQYQTYGGQMISEFPGSEVSIQEITSKPDMIITMEQGMKPEEILQLAEGEIPPLIQSSSSSVTAVVQQVTKRIIKTRRRIIRRVVVIDGKEHVTEEVIEEPDSVEMLEEQIPRVSINVKDSAFTSEEGNDTDDKGQPPKKHPNQGKGNESHDVDEKFVKDEQDILQKLLPSDFQKNDTEILGDVKQPLESSSRISQVQYQTNEFLQEESLNDKRCHEIPQVEKITISKSHLPDDSKQITSPMYDVETPYVGQTGIYTTQIMSNTETNSNIATVVQKVTRKLTRTRKRIIKHIQIIDGKEHVTEEVIEEPDEVEIVEDEPQISHLVQNQGKTRRIKLIRQVEMIDGKEHITEQMVEESDDEPDDSIVFDKSTIKLDRPDITEIEAQETDSKNSNISDVSKPLIVTETGDESKLKILPESFEKTKTIKPMTKVTRIRKRIIKHIKVIDGKEHVTEEVIDEPDEENVIIEEPNVTHVIQEEGVKTKRIKIIRQVNIIDGKEHVTERIIEDTDDEYVPDSTIIAEISVDINKPDQENSGLNQFPSDKANQHLINITKNLIGSEVDHSTVLKNAVNLTEAITPTSERTVKEKDTTEKPSNQTIKQPGIYDSSETKKLNEQSFIYAEEPVLKEKQNIDETLSIDIAALKTIDEDPLTMETKTSDEPDVIEKTDIIYEKSPTRILGRDRSLIGLTEDLIQSETNHGTILHPSASKVPVKISKQVLTSEQQTVIEPSSSPTIEILETKGETENLLETKVPTDLYDPIKEKVVSEDAKLKKGIETPSKIETEKHSVIHVSEEYKNHKPGKLAIDKDIKVSDHSLEKFPICGEVGSSTLVQPVKSSEFEIIVSEENKTDMTGTQPNKMVDKDLIKTGLDPQTFSPLRSEEQTTTKMEVSKTSTPIKLEKSLVSEQKTTEMSHLNKITEEKDKISTFSTTAVSDKPKTENVILGIISAVERKVPEDTSIDISRNLIESEIDHSTVVSPKAYIAIKKDTVASDDTDRSQYGTCMPTEQRDIILQHTGVKDQDGTEDQQKVSPTPTFVDTKYIKYTDIVDKGVVLEKPTILLEDKPSKLPMKQIEDESTLTDISKILPSETEAEKYKAMIHTTKELLQSEVDRSSFEIAKEIKPSAPAQELIENQKTKYTITNPDNVSPKVTTMVTRTKKRFVKHIQIIDGKEYVTEEVIDEPDETEIFEQEPSKLMTLQEEGVRSKRIRILRTVQIVDGKERVSEQIIEEPDDEYVPESTVTAEINLQLTQEAPSKSDVMTVPEYVKVTSTGIKTEVKDIEKIKDFPSSFSKPILSATKELIENESDDKVTKIKEHALIEPREKTISATEMLLKALTVQDETFVNKRDEKINKEIELVDKPLISDEESKKFRESADIIEDEPSQREKDRSFERDEHRNAKDLFSQAPTEEHPIEAATILSNINSKLEVEELEEPDEQLNPVIIPSDDRKSEKEISVRLPTEHTMIPAYMSSDGTTLNAVKPTTEHIAAFIESERLDTHLRNTVPKDLNRTIEEVQEENVNKSSQTSVKPEELDNKIQIREISMTIAKTDRSKTIEPKIKVGIKFEELDESQSTVTTCKRDIQACLPTEITIIEEQFTKNDKVGAGTPESKAVCSSAEFIKEELSRESSAKETPTLLVKDQEVIKELPKESVIEESFTEFPKDQQLPKDHFEEYVPTASPTELTQAQQTVKEHSEESIKTDTKDKQIIKECLHESDLGEIPAELTEDSKIIKDHSSQSVPVETTIELMQEHEINPELSTKSDHVEMESYIETDKSISDTESSSLKKYVELQTPTSTESPKPTNIILETKVAPQEPLSISAQSEPISEKGYEPEDASIVKDVIPEKKKRQKKRKSHAVSEETIYPTQTSTEDETAISTPVEMEEPIHQRKIKTKKGKKKLAVEDTFKKPETSPIQSPEKAKAESQNVGEEVVTLSPRDESYHTISETSDINTVRIVEECVGSSPEIHKEMTTTVTYPIPVVEEIATAEYSVQTSPEILDSIIDDKIEIPKETTDTELQTSPIHVSEIVIQTTPIEDKEAQTQTLENITVLEKVEVSNSQIQTSRSETPEQIIRSEITTQVLPSDIVKPDDKFSQTSSPIMEEVKQIVEQDTREIQTSPQPIVPKEEKSTEVRVETTESDIQTMKQETVDQETLTSPTKSKEVTETSIQTPEISLVHTFTQSDLIETVVEPKLDRPLSPRLPVLDTKVVTVDSTQQTSPRIYEVDSKPDTKQIITIDTLQQTSPREETDIKAVVPPLDLHKKEVIYTDSVQQTTPRDHVESQVFKPVKDSHEQRLTMADYTQQTSPRLYSEDSISTSTDEPYEVHLRAQVSIPQATDSFIENERSTEQISILGDTYKQKRRKPKKKTESPLQSPGSLSDPINAELSLSVTPTSEDFSSKETSSIDEGISQLASPVLLQQESYIITQRPSYSDVVQRSKSKSPSPSKALIVPKSGKARLLNTLEKRTQSIQEPHKITEDTMTVALFEPSVEKSYDLLVNKELDGLKYAINNNNADKTEKCIITIIETISIWLEEIQYKIQKDIISGSKACIKPEKIKDVENYIDRLKETVYITEVNEEIITLIETLTRQVHAVNSQRNQSMVKVNEGENEWDKFLVDVKKLSETVEKVKSQVNQFIMSEAPTQQKLDVLDTIEIDNVANIENIRKMFRIYRNLLETNPKRECPSILYNCNDDSKQIENTINTERDRLLQLSSLAEEYEQTLQDFGQITDVAEALLDGKIIVSNLDHLHEEIQKHRKFFVNLSHCRAILESLEDNLDSETRAKYSSLHHSLHDRATIIIDRAAGRAQQMTLAASRWSVLDQGMKEEQQWLGVAQQRIPDLTNVTSIDHEQYINLYQSISLDVSHHNAKMLRLLSITEGLQGLIVCSGLETECSIALDTLLRLQEDIDSRLTRLTAFKENWVTYDYLIDRIEGWMKLANKELEQITPENITTTSNLRRFWELKAQHEVHNTLKNESGIQFEKALEILPISDEMVQRQFFSKIEDKWRDLSTRISNIHASAIQNISDRDVSSSEKLNILEDEMRELRAMLEGLKGVIKSDDELNLYIERLQVMTSRIDRIQNELGRLSLLPTAESERLGALLTQSSLLDDQIAEELERSLLLKEKIDHVQAGIARCQKNQRRAKLTLEECEAAERLGSDVVERASQNCQKLLEDLSAQWRDILALRQALHTLPISLRVCVSPVSVEKDISALQEAHAELEAACTELSARLRSKLQLWRRFERQLELVQGAVREADYMVELLTVQGQVDYDRLLKATEKLETLSESLSRRSGELVGELRDAAAPLVASTEPGIAAKLRKELDDAAAAYEHTCSNLTQLCDKYHKAVDLWRRYREAAAGVRAFADHHEAFLHALRPHDAPAAAQACLEQEARVAELRSLAARVAAETGSRALQADADALARRLQLVAGAVQALADLGEARQLARAKAQHAKEMFCDMKQDLTPVHEDSEIVEDKLIALRDNLIALGKSEADIAPAKAELPDIDRDVSDEHSIVRILELWQAMFRDTFLHYHRLSTALVRSGDAATALRLWNEYLLDLQSFLSGSVPADYENLTEHRRLCRVHRNLLASQRSVLMNENRETKNRDLSDKFDTLTNLHNETLARIVERHDEVCTRIAAWDEYREIYTELLRWLKEIEREKEKLQLRYVHIKRIHKILAKIQNLTDRLPEGRKYSEKLLGNLKKVLEFTDDTYGASVRMEYAGIVKRVDNLQASLETWRDFLTRILGLIGEYETLTGDLQKLYSKTQNEITSYSDEDRLSRPQLKKAIDKYSDLRKKIDRTETQIEALSVIQEQLKECLSPQDIRIVNQKVWQLRQQRADLEHQLSIIIHRLQERLEIYTIFDSRLSRFAEWMTILESRLETTTSTSDIGALDPQDLIRRISSDIQAETAMKEREFEWLTETGSALVDLSKKDEKSYSKNTSKHLKDVQERWHRLQETGRSRISKINELLETITQLEERLTEIRLRLHSIEANLSAPVVLEHLTTKAVDSKFQERDEIHKDIENESGEVGKTLNLCELIFNDPDVLKGNFDLRNLHTGVDIVEKKWKNICDMSEQRKKALKEIRKSAELANSLLPKVEKKLDAIEKRVEKIETRKQRGEAEDESVSKAVIKDLDNLEGDIKKLEDAYSRVASARGIELRGHGADDAARLRGAVRRWQQLRGRVDAAGADAHRQFVAAHGKAVVALAEADVRLTRALHLAPTPTDKEATLKELDGVEEDLRECEALVDDADRLSVAVTTVPGVADMVAEYRALFADVRTRLELARAEVVGDVDSAVQVDTLKWETDAALQVDTLTSKETYRVELASAVKETSEALEALRTTLLHEVKENAGSDELATAAKDIAKAGAKPEQTLELAKHLSELLLTECDANEEEAMLKEVESLSLRYEDLLAQAKKRELQINNLRLPHSASYALTCEHESGRLTCPLCSDRNWKQLDNDLWRLEQWLQFAEATDEARTDPPEQYDALEDAIQDHREFLLDLDSHKALVVSLNVVGSHVTRHAKSADDAQRVEERLAAANQRWDRACSTAAAWQGRLQTALVHNREFHDIVIELVAQLAAAERTVRAREPLRLARPPHELRKDFRRFSELRDELSRAEPRVLALRDAAQLLKGADAQDVCRRLGELRLRLQSLRKLSGVYALKLGAALARHPPHAGALAAAAAAPLAATQLTEEDEDLAPMSLPPLDENDVILSEEREEQELGRVQRGLRFVCRVARASLPFQALLLLLLGAAALAPLSPNGDCRGPAPSFQPVLRYPHGPPPL